MDPAGSASADPGTYTAGREIMYLDPGDIVGTCALSAAFFDIFPVLVFAPFTAVLAHTTYLAGRKLSTKTIIIHCKYYTFYLDNNQYIMRFI